MFQVVWSSVVHVFCCYPGFVVYISPILSLLVQGLLSLQELLWLSSPTLFQFRFQGLFFWQFFSYMNWSILFCGGGHINKQAAFFLFVLDNDVCFVGLYLTSCQYLQDCDVVSLVPRPVRAIQVTRVGLEPSATVWGSCSYHFSFPALWKLLSYVKILNWKKYILASILVNNQI